MRIKESIAISRPPDEDWLFLTDFFNYAEGSPGTLAIRRTSLGPWGEDRSSKAGSAHRSAFRDLKRMLETNSPQEP